MDQSDYHSGHKAQMCVYECYHELIPCGVKAFEAGKHVSTEMRTSCTADLRACIASCPKTKSDSKRAPGDRSNP